MTTPQLFEPVDAMAVRREFGEVLDKVLHGQQRFVIQRRGKARALLVPLSDGDVIAHGITQRGEHLDAVYAALERARGVIKDPAMHDASSTIDQWIYRASDQEDDGG